MDLKMFSVAEVERLAHGRAAPKNAHYSGSHTFSAGTGTGVAKANGLGEYFEPVIQQFITQTPRVVEAVSARLPAELSDRR